MVASLPRVLAQDGANDPTFNAADDGTYGEGANGPVSAFALQADGKVLIAGNFVTYNGVVHSGIARVTADGMLDASFDPDGKAFFSSASSAPTPRLRVFF